MKTKKLNLQDLKVSSFTTNLTNDKAHTAKGGSLVTIGCDQETLTCEPFTAGHCPFKNDYTVGIVECY